MSLIGLVITLLVVGLLWWCVQRLLRAFNFGEPITSIVMVVFVILVCFALIGLVTDRPLFVRIW
jgi:uncharacterized membrane protein